MPDHIILVSEFGSSQQWAIDPEKVLIRFPSNLIPKVEEGLAWLKTSGFDRITMFRVADYTMLSPVEDDDFDKRKEEPLAEGFAEFIPEFAIDQCRLEINAIGEVYFTFPFEHTDDYGWTKTRWMYDEATRTLINPA